MIDQNIAENERILVKKSQKDSKYFGELYEMYKDRVESFIFKKVSLRDVAEDLTSKVFEKALKKINLFRWQGVSFGCWLFKIARNVVYDYYRTNKNNKLSSLKDDMGKQDDSGINFEASILHDEKELELYKVIAQLSEKDQQLLYFRYFEGLNNKEISRRIGMSVSNVATRIHRIRKKMKGLLD